MITPEDVILTSAKIFRFLPVTCRVSGRHATGRKENLTAREYKKISDKLYMENMDIPNDNRGEDLSEEISRIVFRRDAFECGSDTMVDRHIDIEYSFGECYEVHEETPLFQYICSLCGLSLLQEEREEVVIYQED